MPGGPLGNPNNFPARKIKRKPRNDYTNLMGRGGHGGGTSGPKPKAAPGSNRDNKQVFAPPVDIMKQIQANLAAKNTPNTPVAKPAPAIMPTGTGVGYDPAGIIKGMIGTAGGNLSKVGAGRPTAAPSATLPVKETGSLKRARNAAGIEYDPQIAAIEQLVKSTQQTGDRGIQQTGDAYSALRNSIQGQLPGVNANFDNAQAQQAELYAKLTGNIDARYNATNDRNAAEMQRLGIQAAAPASGAALTSDRDFLSGIAGLQGAGVQSALELQQQGAANSTRNNATRAGYEGANRQDDMRNTLASKLLEMRGQKTSLVGGKAKSIRELQDQYTQEATAQAERDRAYKLNAAQFNESVTQDRRNFRYNKTKDLSALDMQQAQLGLDANTAQQKAAADATKGSKVDLKSLDPQETMAYKADQLKPGSGPKLIAYMQQLVNSNKDVRRGFRMKQTPDGKGGSRTTQIKITPEEFGYIAAKQAKSVGLPASIVQKLATAYWMEK